MSNKNIIIRKAVEDDTDELWVLMRDLAIFERYIDSFAITPEIVKEKGFRKMPPDFHCIVADVDNKIAGMLVYYFLTYTARNRPTIYMKELYVSETSRGNKLGERLMESLHEVAIANNCTGIKWTVAPWNEAGQRFYERLGAKENRDWLNYEWSI